MARARRRLQQVALRVRLLVIGPTLRSPARPATPCPRHYTPRQQHREQADLPDCRSKGRRAPPKLIWLDFICQMAMREDTVTVTVTAGGKGRQHAIARMKRSTIFIYLICFTPPCTLAEDVPIARHTPNNARASSAMIMRVARARCHTAS